MKTVVVTKVPGVSKSVNFDGSMSISEILTTAEIEIGSDSELRFNGAAVSDQHDVAESGTLLITRVIKSNA